MSMTGASDLSHQDLIELTIATQAARKRWCKRRNDHHTLPATKGIAAAAVNSGLYGQPQCCAALAQ